MQLSRAVTETALLLKRHTPRFYASIRNNAPRRLRSIINERMTVDSLGITLPGRVAAITPAITTKAAQNQRNESSKEMLLVLSFWVTPVIPKKTNAMVASQIQLCMFRYSTGK